MKTQDVRRDKLHTAYAEEWFGWAQRFCKPFRPIHISPCQNSSLVVNATSITREETDEITGDETCRKFTISKATQCSTSSGLGSARPLLRQA